MRGDGGHVTKKADFAGIDGPSHLLSHLLYSSLRRSTSMAYQLPTFDWQTGRSGSGSSSIDRDGEDASFTSPVAHIPAHRDFYFQGFKIQEVVV